MKIAVLTTDTPAHRFFVNGLEESNNRVRMFLEIEPADPEGFKLPVGVGQRLKEFHTWGDLTFRPAFIRASVNSLNDQFAVDELKRFEPDLILVNGTAKLSKEIIAIKPQGIVNFHSGDPRHYRGLHCDMWTIWHKDWNNLGVCAHRVVAQLDAGMICDAQPIEPPVGLAGLRVAKAEAAAKLGRRMVERFDRNRVHEESYAPGRYYGAMPTVLQEQVDEILRARAMG